MNNKLIHRSGLVLFIILVILPFVGGILYAGCYSTGLTGLLAQGFTGRYWLLAGSDSSTWQSLAYSFCIAAVSIALATGCSFCMISYFKDSLATGKNSYWLYLPLCIPSIVTAFLSFQLLGKSGIFSRIAIQAHLIPDQLRFPDLINDKFAIGIIITHTLMAFPFFVIYFSNIFRASRLRELEQVAVTLGSSRYQVFSKLLVPVLLNKGLPVLLLYFVFVSGSYEIPLLLGRQSPQMISLLILRKIQHYNLADIPQGYAIGLLYVVMLLAIMTLFIRLLKKEPI